MQTIESLRKQLAEAEKAEVLDAKYPTGIIIDLNIPEGNVFYIMGLASTLPSNSARLMMKYPPISKPAKTAITKMFCVLAKNGLA